jgi:hypothetical protein
VETVCSGWELLAFADPDREVDGLKGGMYRTGQVLCHRVGVQLFGEPSSQPMALSGRRLAIRRRGGEPGRSVLKAGGTVPDMRLAYNKLVRDLIPDQADGG